MFRVEKLLKSVGLLDAVKKDVPSVKILIKKKKIIYVPSVEANLAKFQDMDGKASNMTIST